MSHHPYHALVADFLKRSDLNQTPPSPEDLGKLSFTLGEFTCEVYPDEEQTRVTVQVMVTRLDQLPSGTIPRALRMLHGINWIARNTTGIMASISIDDEVVLSKSLSIIQTDGILLGAEMAALLDAAVEMKSLLLKLPVATLGTRIRVASSETTPLPRQLA
jgi:hypothetical protein